jgi:microcystin-dependent protein
MPDTFTSALGLTKPEVGSSRDTWGSKTNDNWDIVDGFISRAMPIGAIIDFAGPNAPSGFLICDGRLISRTTYSLLFAVIGTYWGSGDGATTFALPNMNGRAGVGPGAMTDQGGNTNNFPFTQRVGYIWNTITQAVLPNYEISIDYEGAHNHGTATAASTAFNAVTDTQGSHNHGAPGSGNHVHVGTTDAVGNHTHGYTQTAHAAGDFIGGGNSSNQIAITGQQTDPAGAHTHPFTTGSSNFTLAFDGNHAHNVTVAAHTHAISTDGSHTHYAWLNGGGSPFAVLSPIIVVTKIIFAGDQASLTAFGAVVDVPAESDTRAQIDALREEIAQLKRLFAPPGGQRLLSAPMRGPH